MREFIKVMGRYLPPFKKQIILNFLFNLLSAVFAVFSVAMMKPILEILFGMASEIHEAVSYTIGGELSFKDVLMHNLSYFITGIKNSHGPGLTLLFVGLIVTLGTIFKVGFAYAASRTMVTTRNGVVKNVRNMLFSKLTALPLGFYSEERKGDIMARITGDVSEMENSIMTSLNMFLKNPVLIIVFLISMLLISAQLTGFIFIMLPIAGFVIGRVGKNLKRKSKAGQQKMGSILGIIEETLGGLRIVKAFNAEEKVNKKFEEHTDQYRHIMTKLMNRYVLAHPMSELLGTLVIVIIVWFGGTLILNGKGNLDGPSFIVFIAIFYQIINPAKDFTKAFYSIQKGLAAAERVDKILLAENTITDKPDAITVDTFKHSILYKDIEFAYDERTVIDKVNLEIKKGQTVALVGQSGSGKTTMVDLLPRFYDIQKGSLTIDGVDIRDMKLHSLRSLMGNVNQEAILFNDTIYNNIAFGVDSTTQEEVEQAAKIANAHNFILETDNGYNTVIGDRGSRLSGGQRQRLSIARAILANPPILILDEATSALDTESERLVQDAIEKLMKNRTTIVIAHRLSTVKNADIICVMHQGKIVERGSHQELLDKNGAYKKLHEMQMF